MTVSPESAWQCEVRRELHSSTKATSNRFRRLRPRGLESVVSRLGEHSSLRRAARAYTLGLRARRLRVLVHVFEELDVSGGAPLEQRHGLSPAVEMVEAGEAEVVVVAYFDRLVRSLAVQARSSSRRAGRGSDPRASMWGRSQGDSAAGNGHLGNDARGRFRIPSPRRRAERTADAKREPSPRSSTFPNVPPGYRKREDGERIEPTRRKATVVAEAFRLRAAGATMIEVRDFLRENGIQRTFHGTQSLLESRIVLGELPFGES